MDQAFFKNRFQEILFIAVLMLSFITFYVETDIYTPSFPDMVDYFATNEDIIQMILSMNFLGLCLSSLFFGPASDSYGRKPVLCVGLAIFLLGSIGCCMTNSLNWMIGFRLLQGIGCGSIVSAGLATFFDIYPPEKSSRLVAFLNGTVGGMMALAPWIGNWVNLTRGWRTNFYIIAVLAFFSFFCSLLLIKETHPQNKRTPLSLSTIVKKYLSILTNASFMAHTLIWCLSFSMVIVFIANLSLIFVDYLNVPKVLFGYYQMSIMGAFFLGSMSASYLIKRLGMHRTKFAGSLIYISGVLSLAILSYLNVKSPFLLVSAMASAGLGGALALTIYFSYSMHFVPDQLKASAVSLTQFLRLFLSSSLVSVAASWFDGTTVPMATLALASTIFCSCLYVFLYKRKQHLIPDQAVAEVPG